jgi:hypothetical protein
MKMAATLTTITKNEENLQADRGSNRISKRMWSTRPSTWSSSVLHSSNRLEDPPILILWLEATIRWCLKQTDRSKVAGAATLPLSTKVPVKASRRDSSRQLWTHWCPIMKISWICRDIACIWLHRIPIKVRTMLWINLSGLSKMIDKLISLISNLSKTTNNCSTLMRMAHNRQATRGRKSMMNLRSQARPRYQSQIQCRSHKLKSLTWLKLTLKLEPWVKPKVVRGLLSESTKSNL